MTRDELKKRCEEMARVGDTQAWATMDLFRELAHCHYIINRVGNTLQLARELIGIPDLGTQTQAMPPAGTKYPPGPADFRADEPGGQTPSQGFPPGWPSPEEVAAAATRKAQGLPEKTDPGATAQNPDRPAGAKQRGSGV
jgi:hypothetical protein